MLLVFLQCAYRDNGKEYPSRDVWETALWNSHTGRRLTEMIPVDEPVWVDNASPIIGEHVDAIFPADLLHMGNVIADVQPSVILACGRVAQKGLDALGLDYIPAPHPAWRALSKAHTTRVREVLTEEVKN